MIDGFAVVSAEPGTLELLVKRLKDDPDLARKIRQRFAQVHGIREVEADHDLGTVRIRYDRGQLTSLTSLFALKSAFSETFPEVDPLKLAGWLSKYI